MYKVDGNVISIQGDLTMYEAPALKEEVRELIRTHTSIVFDLMDARIVNSSGLSTFALAAKFLPGAVTLRNVPVWVRRILAISRLDKFLHLE